MTRLLLCVGVLLALDALFATADVPPWGPLALVLGLASNSTHREQFEDPLPEKKNARAARSRHATHFRSRVCPDARQSG
jgi:hypothetical protein